VATVSPAEQVEWIDVDVEFFLLHGNGSTLESITVRELLHGVGMPRAVCRALREQGFKPIGVAGRALYRLGWAKRCMDKAAPKFDRPPDHLARAQFPDFAKAIAARIEQYVHVSGDPSTLGTLKATLAAVDASHLDSAVARRAARAALQRMGFRAHSVSGIYQRLDLTTSLFAHRRAMTTHMTARCDQRSRCGAEKVGAAAVKVPM
jgi:hypothetical protein